jgi:AcrR family transcriptional regulator
MKPTIPNFRTIAESLQSAPPFPVTHRDRSRHENIIECARIAFAEFGFTNISTSAFTVAMRITRPTLRRHFGDLHGLLAEIVRRHLEALETLLANIGPNAPDPARARRAAYLAATRHPCGSFTTDHLILTRDCPSLPPDMRAPVEVARQNQARLLAGPNCFCPETILSMLDIPAIDLAHMEDLLATYLPPLTPGQQSPQSHRRLISTSATMPSRRLTSRPPGHLTVIH